MDAVPENTTSNNETPPTLPPKMADEDIIDPPARPPKPTQ